MRDGKNIRNGNRTNGIIFALTIITNFHTNICAFSIDAFVPLNKSPFRCSSDRQHNLPSRHFHQAQESVPRLWSISQYERSTSLSASNSKDISSMRASEMRDELESYGISTKSFFEKSQFAAALEKARAEGKTPIDNSSNKSSDTKTKTKSKSKKSNSESAKDSMSRDEKITQEIEKIKSMKVGEIKDELKSMGISTKSFFEKTEFVKALAEARVDGKKKGKSQPPEEEEEEYDPSYKDVIMQKFNGPSLRLGSMYDVIDIKI